MEHPADPQVRFLARLGAAMGAANYPVTLIRQMLDRASAAYGTSHEVVALPNSVQVTGPAPGGTATAAAHQDAELRFDQMFPLARLVSAAMRGGGFPDRRQ